MRDNSLYRLGGICSFLVAASYVVIGVTQLLLPEQFTAENNARMPLLFFAPHRALFTAQWSAMLWGAVFALAVIPAISEKVRGLGEGWVRWTSTLAMLGFAVTILDNYWSIVLTPAIDTAYRAGNEAARVALGLPTAPQFIDMRGWLGYGAVGLWVLVVNLLALRGRTWPKRLAYLGIACAIGYFLVLASILIPNFPSLGLFVAGIGGIVVGPAWYSWIGMVLYRSNSVGANLPAVNEKAAAQE